MGDQVTIKQDFGPEVSCTCSKLTMNSNTALRNPQGIIQTEAFCFECNTALRWNNGEPTVTPMVPVPPKANADQWGGLEMYAEVGSPTSRDGMVIRVRRSAPSLMTRRMLASGNVIEDHTVKQLQWFGLAVPLADEDTRADEQAEDDQ